MARTAESRLVVLRAKAPTEVKVAVSWAWVAAPVPTVTIAHGLYADSERADEIDALVREDTRAQGGKPSQLGYKGFPAAVCVSPNAVGSAGIADGSFVTHVDPSVAATGLWAMMEGVLVLGWRTDRKNPDDAALDTLTGFAFSVIINGLMPR